MTTSEQRPAPTVVAGIVQALLPHAPFSSMAAQDVADLVRDSHIAYFASGDTVLAPSAARPEHCYVIKQGAVRGESADVDRAEALFELGPGEMFALGALLGHRGPTSRYRAAQDTFCVVFPASTFDRLVERSPPFRDFCTHRLAYLLESLRARVQQEYVANLTSRRDMATKLADLTRGEAVTSAPGTALEDALRTMEERRIGSIPVVDASGRPLGIFTRQDVIARVVLPRLALATPISDVMSAPTVTLPGTAEAADAALVMAQRGIRHVVLTDEAGRVAGVVSERDLFALHRMSVRDISSAIRHAQDLASLVHCAADIRTLSLSLVAQGIASGPLTRLISGLNDRLTSRILELTAPSFGLDTIDISWLGLGSEGREEQTIATDQDNAIVFVAGAGPDEVRERLRPFAKAVNEALDRCGYPLCKGGIMAMNPQWCLSVEEWRATFARWIDSGEPKALLAVSIFFDFRSLWGNEALAHDLRTFIAPRAQANVRFQKQLAENAMRNRPPLSWRGEIVEQADASGAEGIDVKLFGSMPITDAARLFALGSGIHATGTMDRMSQAGARIGIAEDDIAAWRDAFAYLQMLRLRTQHRRIRHELAPSANANLVPVASLPALDRRVLKEALRQVRKLQQRLALDFP
jgi:CBS domain-containing protein